jgi:hypothetical protein
LICVGAEAKGSRSTRVQGFCSSSDYQVATAYTFCIDVLSCSLRLTNRLSSCMGHTRCSRSMARGLLLMHSKYTACPPFYRSLCQDLAVLICSRSFPCVYDSIGWPFDSISWGDLVYTEPTKLYHITSSSRLSRHKLPFSILHATHRPCTNTTKAVPR